jgi:hypothetical protein
LPVFGDLAEMGIAALRFKGVGEDFFARRIGHSFPQARQNKEYTMKYLAVGFAIVAMICALIAAHFWYQSTQLGWPFYSEPRDEAQITEFALELWQITAATGRFNRIAAIWTAAAAICGAFSSLLETLF